MTTQNEKLIEQISKNAGLYKKAADDQLKVWQGRKPEVQPLLLFCTLDEQDNWIERFNYKEIFYDSDKMLSSELTAALTVLYGGMGAVPSVRANMGCGVFPTLLGVKESIFPDKMPWVLEHISKEKLMRMSPGDIVFSDEFKLGLEHMHKMARGLEGSGIGIYPMDLQGAFDTAHIVYGDNIFYDIYDDPDFVHHILDLSCHAMFMGMEAVLDAIPDSSNVVSHYNCLVMPGRKNGGIKISEDTSTLLSREQIQEFVTPYIKRIMRHFGGGYVHYCGRNDHLLNEVLGIPEVTGLNFGQPEKHDMEEVLKKCVQADKVYYGKIKRIIKDEQDEKWLRELYEASLFEDGRSNLLLNIECAKKDRGRFEEFWNSMCSKAVCNIN